MNTCIEMSEDQVELAQSIDWGSIRILAVNIGAAAAGIAAGSYAYMVSGMCDFRRNIYVPRTPAQKLVFRLDELRKVMTITEVVYYEPRRTNAKRKDDPKTQRIASLTTTLQKWAADNGLPCRPVASGLVRKEFTGRGDASKEKMIAECERRNFVPFNDNDAGAIATLHWALFDHIATAGKTAAAN